MEWLIFLLPCARFTRFITYMFLSIYWSKEAKFECYFLLLTLSFLSSECAFLSNLPMDLVECCAAPNWATTYFFLSLRIYIFYFLFSYILFLRDSLCWGLSSLSSFYFFVYQFLRSFGLYTTFLSMKWGFGFFILY